MGHLKFPVRAVAIFNNGPNLKVAIRSPKNSYPLFGFRVCEQGNQNLLGKAKTKLETVKTFTLFMANVQSICCGISGENQAEAIDQGFKSHKHIYQIQSDS